MSDNPYSELLMDLTSLYLKTRRSDFIPLIQKIAYVETHMNFESWLNSKETLKTLRPQLNDPDIITALNYMFKLSSTYPGGLSKEDATRLLSAALLKKDSTTSGMDANMAISLPYFFIFRELTSDPELGEVLSRFSSMLNAFSAGELGKMDISDTMRAQVSHDLRIIWNTYQSTGHVEEMQTEVRESRSRKIYNMKKAMFSRLLVRMSTELADHVRGKNSGLADALMRGELVTPYSLGKYTRVWPTIMRDKKSWEYVDSKATAKDILKKYGDQYENENYNVLKASALEPEGFVPMEDPYSSKSRKEGLVREIMDVEDHGVSHSVVDQTELLLQPNVLTRLGMIFMFMYEEVVELGKKV